jgi:hypothetical protein
MSKQSTRFDPCIGDTFLFIYTTWCIIVSIIDAIVCGDIFYTVCIREPYNNYCYNQQLYNLPGMDYILSHWLQVYGATSVTKLAVWPSIIINPLLILIINSYLYATSLDINSVLGPQCNQTISAENQTITCQVFNNRVQYQQLTDLNKIQLFGSISVVCLIPAFFMFIFGINVFIYVPKYIYDVIVRIHEILCCRWYKNMCQNIFYIFCYGPKPTSSPKLTSSPNQSSSKNIAMV